MDTHAHYIAISDITVEGWVACPGVDPTRTYTIEFEVSGLRYIWRGIPVMVVQGHQVWMLPPIPKSWGKPVDPEA